MDSFYQTQLNTYRDYLRNRFLGNTVALVLIDEIIQHLRAFESYVRFNRLWCMQNLGRYYAQLVVSKNHLRINGEFSFGYFKAAIACERFRDNLKSACPSFFESSFHHYCEEVIAVEEKRTEFCEIMKQISVFPA